MDSDSLETFLVVMQQQSVSKAAELLYVTQPAVSKRIQGLEQRLGVSLFYKAGRNIRPTQAALQLLPIAKRWQDEFAVTKMQLQSPYQQVVGKLSIATSHHIGLHHLAPILKGFCQTYPAVELDVHFVDSETAHQQVMTGELPLAFITLPHQHWSRRDHRLSYQSIWCDQLVFVAASHHLLAKVQSTQTLTMATLCQYPAVLPAVNTFTSQIVLNPFYQQGLSPNIISSTNALASIRMLVSIGIGWSVLPISLLTDDLVTLPLSDDPNLTRELGVISHPNHTHTQAAESLLQDVLSTKNDVTAL